MSVPVLIIPVLNRFDLLEQVLDSIDYPVDNILIVDNSNSYKTNRSNVHVLNMPSNFGVAGSWNLGIKCFPHSPYWVIGSNDNIWLPKSMKKLNEQSSADNLVLTKETWNTFSIGSNIIKKIGLFDENYYPAYHEDVDYLERVILHNMKDSIKRTDIPMKLFDNGTTMRSNEKFKQKNEITSESNRLYFIEKFYGKEDHQNCYSWNLQRHIDNDWTN